MAYSYWEQTEYFGNYDIAIVGSGIVGLTTAIFLLKNNSDLRICILERGNVPTGASTKNAGFACFGSLSELIDDEKIMSVDDVISLVEKRWRGLQLLRQLVNPEKIDYKEQGGYELFTYKDESLYKSCIERLGFYNEELGRIIGNEIYSEQDSAISRFNFNNVSHVIYNDYEAQLNPVLLIKELSNLAISLGTTILYNTEVNHLNDNQKNVELICGNELNLRTKKVVICTNGFTNKLIPDLNVEAHRAQVLITFPVPQHNLKGTYHLNKGYYYFRDVGERILIGGARNTDFETEKTDFFGTTDQIQNELEKMLKEMVIPGLPYTVQERWSGIMGLGKSKLPITKWVNENTYCAVRLGGMGIALGSLIGQQAAKQLLSKF